MAKYMCLLIVLALVMTEPPQLHCREVLSLVSSGDNDICLGELITFTCTGYEITYLQWNLTDHSGSYQSKIFSANYDAGIGMIENLNGFKVNLTRIDANGSSGNITLELSALVRLELNETIIECLTLAQDGKKSKQMILIVEDYSAPLANLSSEVQDIIMTSAYNAEVLLVTWNEAATPHSLYNCTVIQLSGEIPDHYVATIMTDSTNVVLVLHYGHNYSVSVTATSPTLKCSSQPQNLSVASGRRQNVTEHSRNCMNNNCVWFSLSIPLLVYSALSTAATIVMILLSCRKAHHKGGHRAAAPSHSTKEEVALKENLCYSPVFPTPAPASADTQRWHRAAVPSHSTKEEVALKENLCYGPVVPPLSATQTMSEYEEFGLPSPRPL